MSDLCILTVVGARPQCIKAAVVSRAIRQHNQAAVHRRIAEDMVHTGQHDDHRMSQAFLSPERHQCGCYTLSRMGILEAGQPTSSICSAISVTPTPVEVGGLSEIIAHGTHGMLVRSRSAPELAGTVRQVTEDRALRDRIIQNARCRVQSLFAVDTMSLAIRKVYEEVAAR